MPVTVMVTGSPSISRPARCSTEQFLGKRSGSPRRPRRPPSEDYLLGVAQLGERGRSLKRRANEAGPHSPSLSRPACGGDWRPDITRRGLAPCPHGTAPPL